MPNTDPYNILKSFQSISPPTIPPLPPLPNRVDGRLLLLPLPLNGEAGAEDVNQWRGIAPPLVMNANPLPPGAAGLGNLPLLPVAANPVTSRLPTGVPAPRPGYPTVGELADTLYNETSSQRQAEGGSSLDSVREAMDHVVLNRRDQRVSGTVAPNTLKPEAIQSVLDGIAHPDHGPSRAAADAWFSSLNAALGALNRPAPPANGPASGVFYNGRSDARTTPNTKYARPAPFLGTFGPYNNARQNPHPWWAFFGNPDR